MFNKKGFTLIELLVVIAIIGILASIVLVSFPTASKKAQDSRIVSAISQARTVMTYVYSNDSNYAAFTKTTPAEDMVAIDKEITDRTTWSVVKKTDNSAACMYALLTVKASYWYCADSGGKAGFTTMDPSGAAYCATTNAVCPDVTG